MRVGLVGCVKSKQNRPAPARDLYTSPLFRSRREHVERTCERWFVLSALHGLVEPDQVLEPYDATLNHMSADARRRWSGEVLVALDAALGGLGEHVFEVHAGDSYVGYGLDEGLRRAGATVVRPMAGLALGQQLAEYAKGASSDPRTAPPAERPSRPGPRSAHLRAPAGRTGKYQPLREALEKSSAHEVTLSFQRVEEILGFPLPASARRYAAWWQNDDSGGHSQARAWLAAGRLARVNLVRETVSFRKQ